ncbi:unnamed protein product [Mytilus coruscus]|uniref:HAT C-terminal dimerisation domain-containing protein n=1 Tax=Mytilus coruscus TaxID=42192 RepID=A0A6J8B0V1_MYTCO|nr:unnamed protein product [Mytilus coruscus]
MAFYSLLSGMCNTMAFYSLLSARDHIDAQAFLKFKDQAPMKKVLEDKLSENEEAITSAMKVSYHLAVTDQPKSQFSATIDLLDSVGLDLSSKLCKAKHARYVSQASVSEYQSCIAESIMSNIVNDVNKSDFFSVMVDESTDRANKKRLLMYCQYFKDTEIQSDLLANIQITSATADASTIYSAMVSHLAEKGIDISRLIGIGTDGASVMTGKHNGVIKKFQDQNSEILGVHCSAHRCALATSQAAQFVPDIKHYSRVLSNIFYFFSGSAQRSNKLREIQLLLDVPQLKYAAIHTVRWLSLDRAVNVIYRIYPALCVALEHEGSTNTAAKGLAHEVQQYKFIAITHMLLDILPILSRLSKIFQKDCVDFSIIKPVVNSTVSCLSDLCVDKGEFVKKLDQFVKVSDGKTLYIRPSNECSKSVVDNCIFKNSGDDVESDDCDIDEVDVDQDDLNSIELKYYEQQKNVVDKDCKLYVDKVCENLQARFGSDTDVLSNFQVLLPCNIKLAHCQSGYGVDEISSLYDHFEKTLDVTKHKVISDYKQYKGIIMGAYTDLSLKQVGSIFTSKYVDIVPTIVVLLKIAIVIPVSSVPCERGFSTQNRIVTSYRTSVNCKTLNTLMIIKEHRQSIKTFNFGPAYGIWKKAKSRKIYKY